MPVASSGSATIQTPWRRSTSLRPAATIEQINHPVAYCGRARLRSIGHFRGLFHACHVPAPRTPVTCLPWLALAVLLASSGGATVLACWRVPVRRFRQPACLGRDRPGRQLAAFWRYITSGTADPTGRPVALLSFLLDAHDWPADPAPFLRTNLLHLVNATLLFALLRTLGRRLDGTNPMAS